jgi:hypothetical protein
MNEAMFDPGPFNDVRDTLRVLREGGPLDLWLATLTCKKCGTTAEQSLRWFSEQKMICQCGGVFDDTPLTEAIQFRLGKRQHMPDEVREKPE